MTTIRTTCPSCGEVDMGPEDIRLTARDEDGDGTYSFSCPSCRQEIEKDADRKIVALLVSAGVTLSEVSPSAAPSLNASGTALTLDDLIELHFELEDEAALGRFLQGV